MVLITIYASEKLRITNKRNIWKVKVMVSKSQSSSSNLNKALNSQKESIISFWVILKTYATENKMKKYLNKS